MRVKTDMISYAEKRAPLIRLTSWDKANDPKAKRIVK
jgi:hypothetical protein